MVYILLGTGFEETEAIAPCDILKRANIPVQLVGLTGREIRGGHGIGVCADLTIDELDPDAMDMIVLPGGMGGVNSILACEKALDAVHYAWDNGRFVAAICAAPTILAALGITDGRKATCYPGFEKALAESGATYTAELVTVDGNITTAEGPAAAFPYAYELLTQLVDKQTSDQIAEGMRFKHLME